MILEHFEILTQNEIFQRANEKKIIKRLSVVTTFKEIVGTSPIVSNRSKLEFCSVLFSLFLNTHEKKSFFSQSKSFCSDFPDKNNGIFVLGWIFSWGKFWLFN